MSRILLLISLCFACTGTAYAAPMSPRNNKALVIKQTLFLDGRAVTGGGIAVPTVMGSKDPAKRAEMMRDSLGATPINPAVLTAKIPVIPSVDYADLFAKLTEISQYQQQIQNTYTNYYETNYNYSGYYYSNGFSNYYDAYDNCYFTGSYCMQTPYNFSEAANNAYATDPNYAFAIDVRRNVPNAAPGAESVIIYAQNALMRTPAAKDFKQSVINYLRESNIEYAWIDLESEVTLNNGNLMRVASSLQINRSDTPDTPGQYIGAIIVPPPGVDIVSGRRNSVDVVYYTKTQYPDIFNTNINDPIFADKARYGELTWTTTPNGDPVDGTGSGTVQTNGVYDDIFHDENIGTGGTDEYVRSINNINQVDNERGVKCMAEPLTDGCPTGYPTLPDLLHANFASKGTLTYYGRWELQHEYVAGSGERAFPPLTASVKETMREVEYNLCYDVRFFNEVQVQYKIRRLLRKYDVMEMDGHVVLTPQAGYPKWEIENYTLPDAVTYRTNGGIHKPRDPGSSSAPSLAGLTEDMLINKVIVNPVTWSASHLSLSPYASVCDSTGDCTSADETWENRMTQTVSPSITRSSNLPSYVTDATARYWNFTCEQVNSDEISTETANADSGSVVVSGDENGCSVSWTVTTYNNTNSNPDDIPVWDIQVDKYSKDLARPACEESCPADGSTPVKLCPRY